MDLGLITTVVIELLGVAVMFGIMKQKTETNKEELAELKAEKDRQIQELKEAFYRELTALQTRQNQTDSTLQDMKGLLNDINSKVDLLIAGKIKTGE